MALLIGTDEAGYGPNLGPLLISTTAWCVPDDDLGTDLYRRLQDVVRANASSAEHIPMADSKDLYKPKGGLLNLERGLFASLAACNLKVDRWRDAWRALAPASTEPLQSVPWYADYDTDLPIDLGDKQRRNDALLFCQGLKTAEVSLEMMRSTAVFPQRFNEQLDRYDSKGSVLSLATIELVREALACSEDQNVIVQCDKHGGRNRYLAVLQTVFPDERIQIVSEARNTSVYRWQQDGRQVEISFTAKGESFLPAALASIASKYLRELAMKAFNAYWQQHVGDLKPTAGYPVDAKRFKADIEAAQKKLGIEDAMIWRRK